MKDRKKVHKKIGTRSRFIAVLQVIKYIAKEYFFRRRRVLDYIFYLIILISLGWTVLVSIHARNQDIGSNYEQKTFIEESVIFKHSFFNTEPPFFRKYPDFYIIVDQNDKEYRLLYPKSMSIKDFENEVKSGDAIEVKYENDSFFFFFYTRNTLKLFDKINVRILYGVRSNEEDYLTPVDIYEYEKELKTETYIGGIAISLFLIAIRFILFCIMYKPQKVK